MEVPLAISLDCSPDVNYTVLWVSENVVNKRLRVIVLCPLQITKVVALYVVQIIITE